jgi:hypothetical protein
MATSECGVAGVDENSSEIPCEYRLSQIYSTPFLTAVKSPALSGGNPSTTIRYAISKASYVTLTVYNLVGKEIEMLVNEKQPAGEYEIRWNPVGLPSGVYVYRLQAGDFKVYL